MIRKYCREDEAELKRIYLGSGFDYQWPDVDSPLFITKIVVEEDGRPVMAALLKICAEAYLLADPSWGDARKRWETFLELHEAARINTYGFGLDEAYCYLPPQLEKPFGRKLERVGWARNLWTSYYRKAQPATVDLKEAAKFQCV